MKMYRNHEMATFGWTSLLCLKPADSRRIPGSNIIYKYLICRITMVNVILLALNDLGLLLVVGMLGGLELVIVGLLTLKSNSPLSKTLLKILHNLYHY